MSGEKFDHEDDVDAVRRAAEEHEKIKLTRTPDGHFHLAAQTDARKESEAADPEVPPAEPAGEAPHATDDPLLEGLDPDPEAEGQRLRDPARRSSLSQPHDVPIAGSESETQLDERLAQAALATELGDEVTPDPVDVWLSKFRDATLLVLGVVAHAHGASLNQIRRSTGRPRIAVRLSLRNLQKAGLVDREHRPGPDLWFATTEGTRLGIAPYVARLLSQAQPILWGWRWSVGLRFLDVGSEHGPPIFRPSFALADVNTPAALAEVLRGRASHDDRAYALTKLVALNDPTSVPYLVEVAGRSGEEELLSREAAIALGHFNTTESVEALLEIVASRDSIMREAAARSLGYLGVPQAVPALVSLLAFPSALVRVAAIRALLRIGDRSVADDIACALADRDGCVRYWARRTLIEFGAARLLRANPRRLWPLRHLDAGRARWHGD